MDPRIDLPIGDAFVPLRANVVRSLEKADGRRRAAAGSAVEPVGSRDVELKEMFRVAGGFHNRGIVLRGVPGAGKTTGARQLCWLLASDKVAPAELGLAPGTVPVFLPLSHLGEGQLGERFKEYVASETRNPDAADGETEPGPELWNRSPVLWVFDGLDEVVAKSLRVRVAERLKEFLGRRTQDYFLVTSRFQGLEGIQLGEEFVVFDVRPLQPEQAEMFIDSWFRAVCRSSHLARDEAEEAGRAGREREALAQAKVLKGILEGTDYLIGSLRELRTNPLLLTVVCLVFSLKRSLPGRRAELYSECVKVLLESWRKEVWQAQGVKPFEEKSARRVMSYLAWWMHCRGETEGTRLEPGSEVRAVPAAAVTDMARVIAKPLANTKDSAGLGNDGAEFITRMRDESGILAPAGDGCSFFHLTLQESLAASHAVAQGFEAKLVAVRHQSWWREVIWLALAEDDERFLERFFQTLLKASDWDADPDFVLRCLNEPTTKVWGPFLSTLRKKAGTAVRQKVRVLRLLKHDTDPNWVEACARLVEDKAPEVARLAREVVNRERPETEPAISARTSPRRAEAKGEPRVQLEPRSGIALVSLSGGTFRMGDESISNARPIREVTVSPFAIGQHPVTNEEYGRFLADTKRKALPALWDDVRFNQPRQPVVGVSWNDARAFCQWAGVRMPTEAEWEYACRAGSPTKYCYGNAVANLKKYAWYDANARGATHAVGQKLPNAWGLYDMHGNVWE